MLARQASTDGSRAKLGGENVDRRVGKVADPSGVVEIEMSRHDVANIVWAEAHIATCLSSSRRRRAAAAPSR
jgi:hypothetical protein